MLPATGHPNTVSGILVYSYSGVLSFAATLAVFLCYLEVALSYPVHAAKPQLPQAVFQGRAPFEVQHGFHQFSKKYPSDSVVDDQQDRRHYFSKKYPSDTAVDEQDRYH